MKVCIVLNTLNFGCGPFQRFAILQELGHEVHVITLYDSTENTINMIKSLGFDSGNYFVKGFGENSKFNSVLKAFTYLSRQKYDVLHACHSMSQLICLILDELSISKVYIGFEGRLFKFNRLIDMLLCEFTCRLSRRSICISHACFKENKKRLSRCQRVVFYNGVDLTKFTRNKALSVDEDGFLRFVVVSDKRREKNIEHVILAFEKACSALDCNSRIKPILTIFGSDTDKLYSEEIKQMISSSSCNDKIYDRGLVARSIVIDELLKSHVFILASSNEGLSEALAQAMASCLVPICSNIEPNKELINDRVNGLLYPLGDINALSNLILEIVENESLMSSLSLNARMTALEKLDIRKIVRSYEEFFKCLISQ